TRWERGYARGKLRTDPVFEAANRELSGNGLPLLDVGCGMGLLGQYLRECGWRGRYVGIDSDRRKIASARSVTSGCGDMEFIDCDAGNLPEFHGNVAILDALHYMPTDAQQRVLADAARRIAIGGVLMIRNCLRDHS